MHEDWKGHIFPYIPPSRKYTFIFAPPKNISLYLPHPKYELIFPLPKIFSYIPLPKIFHYISPFQKYLIIFPPPKYISRTVPQLWRPTLVIHSVSCLFSVWKVLVSWKLVEVSRAFSDVISKCKDSTHIYKNTSDLHSVLCKLWSKTWHLSCTNQCPPPPPIA